MKDVGKTTRPFGYDLNQMPYDDTMEVMKRFKELDLADRVPKELQTCYNIIITLSLIMLHYH